MVLIRTMSWDSLVGIVTNYGLDDQMIEVWILAGAGKFSLQHHVQTGFGAYPDSYPVGARGSFPGVRVARPWSWPLISIWCQGQRMHGAVPPLLQYAFVTWCLVKHRDNLYSKAKLKTNGDKSFSYFRPFWVWNASGKLFTCTHFIVGFVWRWCS
jgi:hypothetical protein